jgi:hypothetical protein
MVSICHAALATDLSIFKLLMLGGRSANSNFLNMFRLANCCAQMTLFSYSLFSGISLGGGSKYAQERAAALHH